MRAAGTRRRPPVSGIRSPARYRIRAESRRVTIGSETCATDEDQQHHAVIARRLLSSYFRKCRLAARGDADVRWRRPPPGRLVIEALEVVWKLERCEASRSWLVSVQPPLLVGKGGQARGQPGPDKLRSPESRVDPRNPQPAVITPQRRVLGNRIRLPRPLIWSCWKVFSFSPARNRRTRPNPTNFR